MKTRLEKLIFILLLAPLAPLAGLLSGWWAFYAWLPEKWITAGAVGGILLGLLADVFILNTLLRGPTQPSLALWATAFVFYNIGMFGFFMGVPVFNTALAVPAGFVVGARLASAAADPQKVRSAAQRASIFTTTMLTLICAASASVALLSPSTAADLKGTLGLPFTVTPAMIWGLILTGGAGMLAVNWVLTGLSVRLTHRLLKRA